MLTTLLGLGEHAFNPTSCQGRPQAQVCQPCGQARGERGGEWLHHLHRGGGPRPHCGVVQGVQGSLCGAQVGLSFLHSGRVRGVTCSLFDLCGDEGFGYLVRKSGKIFENQSTTSFQPEINQTSLLKISFMKWISRYDKCDPRLGHCDQHFIFQMLDLICYLP